MKKSLAAIAVLAAFAGNALAADVTLYGIIDEGLNYTHYDTDTNKGSSNSFTLDSGIQSGSRFGLKGAEDLGNGYKAGFVLENGFTADDGKMGQGSRLFGREAQLYVAGPFGKLGAGRVGNLVSGNGSYGLVGNLNPLGTSFGSYTAQVNSVMAFALGGRLDNTITYQTPTFAGVTAYAQYSFGSDVATNQVEGESSSNRYYAGGLTYANGGLKLAFAVDSTNYDSINTPNLDDSLTVTLGGSYDFGPAKFYLGGQYFDWARAADFVGAPSDWSGQYLKGFGLTTGVDAPVFGGKAMFALGYLDGEDATDADAFDVKRLVGSVGYTYAFSKRTNVYTVLSYGQDKLEPKDGEDIKPTYTKFVVGLRHSF